MRKDPVAVFDEMFGDKQGSSNGAPSGSPSWLKNFKPNPPPGILREKPLSVVPDAADVAIASINPEVAKAAAKVTKRPQVTKQQITAQHAQLHPVRTPEQEMTDFTRAYAAAPAAIPRDVWEPQSVGELFNMPATAIDLGAVKPLQFLAGTAARGNADISLAILDKLDPARKNTAINALRWPFMPNETGDSPSVATAQNAAGLAPYVLPALIAPEAEAAVLLAQAPSLLMPDPESGQIGAVKMLGDAVGRFLHPGRTIARGEVPNAIFDAMMFGHGLTKGAEVLGDSARGLRAGLLRENIADLENIARPADTFTPPLPKRFGVAAERTRAAAGNSGVVDELLGQMMHENKISWDDINAARASGNRVVDPLDFNNPKHRAVALDYLQKSLPPIGEGERVEVPTDMLPAPTRPVHSGVESGSVIPDARLDRMQSQLDDLHTRIATGGTPEEIESLGQKAISLGQKLERRKSEFADSLTAEQTGIVDGQITPEAVSRYWDIERTLQELGVKPKAQETTPLAVDTQGRPLAGVESGSVIPDKRLGWMQRQADEVYTRIAEGGEPAEIGELGNVAQTLDKGIQNRRSAYTEELLNEQSNILNGQITPETVARYWDIERTLQDLDKQVPVKAGNFARNNGSAKLQPWEMPLRQWQDTFSRANDEWANPQADVHEVAGQLKTNAGEIIRQAAGDDLIADSAIANANMDIQKPDLHKMAVESALQTGKIVPDAVLTDYPDLAEKYGKIVPDAEAGNGGSARARLSQSERANQLKQSIIKKTSQLNTGFDPELLFNAAELGYYYLVDGIRDFGEWKNVMLKDAGEQIRDHLEGIWEGLHSGPEYLKSLRTAAIEASPVVEIPARMQPQPALAGTHPDIGSLYDDVISGGAKVHSWVDFAPVDDARAQAINDATGLDLRGHTHSLDADSIRHINRKHGPEAAALSGQSPVTKEDFLNLYDVVMNPDSVIYDGKTHQGLDVLKITKRINGNIVVVEEVRTGQGKLVPKTMYKVKAKDSPTLGSTSETLLPRRQAPRAGESIDNYTTNPDSQTVPTVDGNTGRARLSQSERANELRKKISEKTSRLNMGIDPELLANFAELGYYYLVDGIRDFDAWRKVMLKDAGEQVKDHLENIWEGLHSEPDYLQNLRSARVQATPPASAPASVSAVTPARESAPAAPTASPKIDSPPAAAAGVSEPGGAAPYGTEDIPLPKYAGNINLNRLQTPDEVKREILHHVETSTLDERIADQVRVHTWEESEATAREMGMSLDDIKRLRIGNRPLTAPEVIKLRDVHTEYAERVNEARTRLREADTSENKANLIQRMLEYQVVHQALRGVTANAGRTLNIFRKMSAASKALGNTYRADAYTRLMEMIGGKEYADKAVELLMEIPEDDFTALTHFLRNWRDFKTGAKLEAYTFANILSGMSTHLTNTLSNIGWAATQMIEKPVAALIDIPVAKLQGRTRDQYLRSVPSAATGYMYGLPTGLRRALYLVQHGFDIGEARNLDIGFDFEFRGGLKNPLNWPSRALRAADAVASETARSSQIAYDAMNTALKEGLRGDALNERVQQLISEPTMDMIERADQFAKYSTFTGDPGAFSKKMVGMLNVPLPDDLGPLAGLRPARFVIKFVQVPMNIFKSGLEYTPGVGATKLIMRDVRTTTQASDVLAKQLIGGMVLAYGAHLASQGRITAAAPKDPEARDQFYRDGKQPYSIQVGNIWLPYTKSGPLSIPLALAAGYWTKYDEEGEIPDADRIARLGFTISKTILDQSYLSGLSQLIDALEDPNQKAQKFVAGIGSQFVPFSGMMRNIEMATDSKVHDTRHFKEPGDDTPLGAAKSFMQQVGSEIATGIPGLAQRVPAKLDMFGQDIERQGRTGFYGFMPSGPSKEVDDPVVRELARLHVYPSMAGKSLSAGDSKIDLTRDEWRELQSRMGAAAYQAAYDTVSSGWYANLDDSEKAEILKQYMDAARSREREQYKYDYGFVGGQ